MSLSCSERYFIPFDLCKANEYADESMQKFDSLIAEFMKEQRIPGGAIALSYNGRLIHRQGYGSTGNESRCLSTSYFRIASISKTITAMAVMQLVEKNKLQLKDKIFNRKGKGILANFVPDGPSVKALERITVRHLLEHSGGWDRETGVDPVYLPPQTVCPGEFQESTTPVALYTNYHINLIQYMIKQTLDFMPGTRHGYSNFGYLVLGQVLEKLTGIPYPIYIHDIINQAGDFWIYEGDELHRLHPNEVRYFENSDSLHPSIMPHHGDIWSLPYGGYHMRGTGSYGGLVASPLQLLCLLSTLDLEHCKRAGILSRESISQMLACPKFEKGSEWYGLGLDVKDKGQTWGHTGYMDGTTTTFRRDKSGYSWVLLFNAGATDQDLDGLVRFALSYCHCNGPSVGLKNLSVNVKNQQISSADGAQIYHILLPLKEIEEYAYTLKLKGYYMQDIDLVVYENEYYVNMIWNHNVAGIDWFYKIYHNVSVSDLETEYDIINQINSGFVIHTLSICTDSKCQTDIYTAVIYMRQRANQTIQKVTHLKEISLKSPVDIQNSSDNIIICSVCYYCEKLYVSTVFEDSKFTEYSVLKADNDYKSLSHFKKENHNQNLTDTTISGISGSCGTQSESNERSPVCDDSLSSFVDNSSAATIKSCISFDNNKGEKKYNVAKTHMTEDEFLDELRHQALLHYGLIYLQIYKIPSRKGIFISAVWSKFKVHECYQRLGAFRFSFMNELLENSGKITPLETIRSYEEDSVLLFAGIWTAGKFRSKRLKTRKPKQNQNFKRKMKRAKLIDNVGDE